MQFFKSVAQALTDFNELNPIAPLQLLLEVRCLFSFMAFDIEFNVLFFVIKNVGGPLRSVLRLIFPIKF